MFCFVYPNDPDENVDFIDFSGKVDASKFMSQFTRSLQTAMDEKYVNRNSKSFMKSILDTLSPIGKKPFDEERLNECKITSNFFLAR